MRSIEAIEVLLIEQKENLNTQETYMEIDGLPRPVLFMERPLFSPPVKVIFEQTEIEAGTASADTQALFDQFYVDIELLRNNVNTILRSRSQISLSALLDQFEPTKGVAEILGYMQIASSEIRHSINHKKMESFMVKNLETAKQYELQAPLVIFNR
jgi:hypothetical protein